MPCTLRASRIPLASPPLSLALSCTDYDYVMYVTAEPPPAAIDASSVLAYALACQYGDNGLPDRQPRQPLHRPRLNPLTCRNRPLVGVVNFNPSCFIEYSGGTGVPTTQCIMDNSYWYVYVYCICTHMRV